MIQWGKTAKGTQRWRCSNCEHTVCRRRPDTADRNTVVGMRSWLGGMRSLTDLARSRGVHRTTLSRRFREVSPRVIRVSLKRLPKRLTLILDGTKIAPNVIVLVAHEYCSQQPLAWAYVEREKFDTWYGFLSELEKDYDVRAIISDGQKGLKKAVLLLFPEARHQRCIAHVVRLSRSWLTKYPHSDAGKELRVLVGALHAVQTQK